jgi:choline dehydrogenase
MSHGTSHSAADFYGPTGVKVKSFKPCSRRKCEKSCVDCKKIYKCSDTYDFIIAGAGTAGSLLAKMLTDNHKISVLVIEPGLNHNDDPLVQDANDFTFNAARPQVSDYTLTGLETGANNGIFTQRTGHGWGGSTIKNFMNTVRGSPQFLEDVAAIGGPAWGPDQTIPIYKSLETYSAWQPGTTRGNEGPIDILARPAATDINSSFAKLSSLISQVSAPDTTTPIVEDFNNAENACIFWIGQSFQKIDAMDQRVRVQAGEVFLNETIVTPTGFGVGCRKLRILSGAVVDRVLFDKKPDPCSGKPVANGVEAFVPKKGYKHCTPDNYEIKQFYARCKVIICASSLRSPGILERSGIGRKEVLQKIKVPAVYINEHVGEGLQTHYGAVFSWVTNLSRVFTNVLWGAFLRIIPGELQRKFQFVALPGTSSIPSSTVSCLTEANPLPPGTGNDSFLIWNLKPHSKGFCHVVERSPFTLPQMSLAFYEDPRDLEDVRTVLRTMRDLILQAQITNPGDVWQVFHPPLNAYDDDAILDSYIKATVTVTDHPLSTNAIGKVVDGRLNVYGVKNLMVADNSIWPRPPDGNTADPAYLVGAQAYRFILEELHKCRPIHCRPPRDKPKHCSCSDRYPYGDSKYYSSSSSSSSDYSPMPYGYSPHSTRPYGHDYHDCDKNSGCGYGTSGSHKIYDPTNYSY